MISLSIVIPIYNEIESLPLLVQELEAFRNNTAETIGTELIFVDDGSSDGSEDFDLALQNFQHLKLVKNYGQTTALKAGIMAAKGDYIALMDGDLQNDPADIPNMLHELMSRELDAVLGWRKTRQDKFKKKMASRLAAKLRSNLLNDDVHDAGCTLKVFTLEAAKSLPLYGELHRFIPTLLKEKGFKYCEMAVNHRSRAVGDSKYSSSRILKGFLDVLGLWFRIRFLDRPLHFFGSIAATLLLLSMLSGTASIILYILTVQIFHNLLNFMALGFFLASLQIFSLGLILDQTSRHYLETRSEEQFRLRKRV